MAVCRDGVGNGAVAVALGSELEHGLDGVLLFADLAESVRCAAGDGVAVWGAASAELSSVSFRLQDIGDAFGDERSLELGERAQDFEEEAAGRAGRVESFAGGDEVAAGVAKLIVNEAQDISELAGESVESVDDENVCVSVSEVLCESGDAFAPEVFAGVAGIGDRLDHVPALALGILGTAVPLHAETESSLGLLFGGDAAVDDGPRARLVTMAATIGARITPSVLTSSTAIGSSHWSIRMPPRISATDVHTSPGGQ